ILRVALYALSNHPTPTLADVRKFYRDEAFRTKLLAQIDNISVREDWEDLDADFNRVMNQSLRPLTRRLSDFYPENEARTITCHPNPLNMAQLIAENKIILVSLGAKSTKLADGERSFLGSIIVEQIRRAAMAGSIKARSFMLYIDETQNFI